MTAACGYSLPLTHSKPIDVTRRAIGSAPSASLTQTVKESSNAIWLPPIATAIDVRCISLAIVTIVSSITTAATNATTISILSASSRWQVYIALSARLFTDMTWKHKHVHQPRTRQQPPPAINGIYEGISPNLVKAVYKVALSMRRHRPSLDSIMRISGTSLDVSIVRALWSAAERLNSLDESPEQARLRAESQRRKSQVAQVAEDSFVQHVRSYGHQVIRESDIRLQALEDGRPPMSTPDMVFIPPIFIDGKSCGWLEYKDYFGFPDNPFVAASEKRQLRRYTQQRGSGAVVYALGFQRHYPNIEGVAVFRAADILEALRAAGKNTLTSVAAILTRATEA